MRSEQQMLDLIIQTAQNDARIRAVMMNGSRVNPNVRSDLFQDFDIVYFVTAVDSFTANHSWIDLFGERMILQLPDAMQDPPPADSSFGYLMQFVDGNRIDLTLVPVANIAQFAIASLSRILLDKDGLLPPLPPPSDYDDLPKPPTAKAFADCCNNFWWVATYVAKGLWREELVYAKHMLDQFMRDELMKMLTWYVGVKTHFSVNLGYVNKWLQRTLEPELWVMLERTYADTSATHTWDALDVMGDLFRLTAQRVADHFGFDYPQRDDERVSAHLHHVRGLPKDAPMMY